ncbi:unnamed protein product, partial [marine sediment metagenome]
FEAEQNFEADLNLTRTGSVQSIVKTGGSALNIDQETGQNLNLRINDVTILRVTDAGPDVINGTLPHIEGVKQPGNVQSATFTLVSVGNPCTMTNNTGGTGGWSAVWTSTAVVTFTHGTGAGTYTLAASSDATAAFNVSSKTTTTAAFVIITSGLWNVGDVIDVMLMQP